MTRKPDASRTLKLQYFAQRLLILAFVTKKRETARGLQTTGQYSDQLLCTWVHKYVGPQRISHKTERYIMFGVGKPQRTARTRMSKCTRAKAEGRVRQLRLIQHAAQAETGLGQ